MDSLKIPEAFFKARFPDDPTETDGGILEGHLRPFLISQPASFYRLSNYPEPNRLPTACIVVHRHSVPHAAE
jgi:hypothetical protein